MGHLLVAFGYDGGRYHGVSEQPGLPTVGAAVRARIEARCGQRARVAWLARTDAGVHADLNLASFWWRQDVWEEGATLVQGGPDDLTAVWVVPADQRTCFARGLARGKRYVYRVKYGLDAQAAEVAEARYGVQRRRAGGAPADAMAARTWQIAGPLDVEVVGQALAACVGTRDFNTFRAPVRQASGTVRTITRAVVRIVDDGVVDLIIEGDSFLRQMVRMVVAAAIEVGRGERTLTRFREDLASANPRRGAWPAPPRGLTLAALDLPPTPLGPGGWTTWATLQTKEEP